MPVIKGMTSWIKRVDEMEIEIIRLDHDTAGDRSTELVELLQDGVDSGASIGFLPPLTEEDGAAYFADVRADLAHGKKDLWVAQQDGRLVGMVQLAYELRANGRHRAEVQKLVVQTAARRQGIGRRLMERLERAARERGLRLLVLDTRQGDPSALLYERLDYTPAGTIPHYALSADGTTHTTRFFYKIL